MKSLTLVVVALAATGCSSLALACDGKDQLKTQAPASAGPFAKSSTAAPATATLATPARAGKAAAQPAAPKQAATTVGSATSTGGN
jgi:hypothetical protein